MSDNLVITTEQVEMLNNMCYGAHEVKLGTLLDSLSTGQSEDIRKELNDKASLSQPNSFTEENIFNNIIRSNGVFEGNSDTYVTNLEGTRYNVVDEIEKIGDIETALDAKADLEGGKIPSSQLPSYVDDVLEYNTLTSFPTTGETGKIYIAKDTNKTYRWSGTQYTEIPASLAIGEVTGTAYEGSKGKANADAISNISETLISLQDSAEQHQTQISELYNTKVDKVEGKGLSTNDLTDKHMLTLNKFDGYDTHVEFNGDSLVMSGNTLFMPNIQNAVQVQAEGEIISNISGKLHTLSEKADETELERLKYYGDKDIIPSDESYFTVNETGETITGLTDTGKTQTELVIPYVINGILITQISDGCFQGSQSITNVIIPKSVTSIGRNAFEYCTSLRSINIPDSVTSICDEVFLMCSSLTSINIPDSVTEIGKLVFDGCSSLSHVKIYSNISTIRHGMFSSCYALKEIIIPESVTKIEYAFSGCTSLTKVNIPNGVTTIDGGVFSDCTNLTIYCEQGSYAETYAKGKNIPVVYTEVSESYVRNLRPYVKNTISATEALSLNTVYDIGVQSDITLILPTAEVGNFIQVDFLSGATAATLTVSASSSALLSDYDFTPEPNMIYSLFFDYGVLGYDEAAHSNIYGWRFNYAEYTYTPNGSEG